MSQIGKKPIDIPQGVEIQQGEPQQGFLIIKVKGPKGELNQNFSSDFSFDQQEGKLFVKPKNPENFKKAEWGLSRALLNNMIIGVTRGFEKRLELEGVGFKASVEGSKLTLNVGFSHPVLVSAPPGIEVKVEKNVIIVSGIDKAAVGQFAANVRKVKPPEPYKGKGIRYQGEVVRRKAGKKAVTAAG